jgi:hypothetical protein
MFIGTWLLLGNLGVLRLEFWDLWPVPLVMAGGFLIWQALHGPDGGGSREDQSVFSAMAVMGGTVRRLATKDFRGGEATALLGGVKLDLRDAAMTVPEAPIDVFAFWGGIEIIVPEGWLVVNRVMPLLGGADDKTTPATDPNPKRLVIRGFCVMGGVEIKNR